MRILFACGGTAGHINPALAVAGLMRERHPGADILFAGNPSGMEATLIPEAGYGFAPIEVLGFQRRLSFRNIKNNLRAAAYLMSASGKAERIIRDFSPDICLGTGGYVSGPVLRKAARMKIPTLTHESNAFPGITTKLLSRCVDKVLIPYPEVAKRLPKGCKPVVTGNPVRREILLADRAAARRRLGVGERICLLSFGGSLGAARVNEAVAELIAATRPGGKLHHIHATGRYGEADFRRLLKERGTDAAGDPHLDIRAYIDDMPDCLAAADLVVCRAGAISVTEIQAAGRAAILIPSPNVAENHQYYNADALASRNAAVLLEEKDLTGKRLTEIVRSLVSDPQELYNIGQNASSMAVADATERICQEMEELLRNRRII
ncbi:MAG: undecaprenyldiphospho-muramoylpentapeptide beta-N-acetylglucosaminyltransferase [Oscillospiraceae bacterium]|nr:undecaprenyldiphospho-muramoylpentapeptide beta-N-acetylglucosaminyltransferase [Oscillospiraceae bacterium]